jgi:hypothetical protein
MPEMEITMSKDNEPDNRRARKKKNIGKLPPTPEAQRSNSNSKKQTDDNNDI